MKVGLSIIILSILLSLCTIGHCYRILGIFPRNSKSQFSVFEVLMKSLADRGHQVDVVSSFPLEHSYDNYHDIIKLPQTSPSLTNNVSYVDIHKKIGTVLGMIKTERGNDVCQALGNSDLMKIIQNPPKDIPYDVVITEMLIANCFMVVGHFLKVPVVGVSTYGRLPWVYDIMGNPEHSNFVSNEVTHQFYPGFWQRIKSFFKDSYEKCSFYHGTQAQDGILTKIFGKKTPTVRELESSVALALTNSHFVSHGQAPVVPGVVEVGGMHIVEERIEPLFDDILDFLDTSKHGVVYVNLGEDLLFETLPEHIIKAFYTTFENIRPIRVLLRIRDFDALPPGIPPNVVTVPWVQQYRVLQHPNTRVFVTHGGILGVQEAMAAGTIMLGIPLGGDQFENIDMVVEHNLGMRLDLDSITVETLGQALNRTLKNETFRKKAQEMMDKFFDRPELPVDTACYWIEYVIKHGSSSLKSPFMKLSWFQTSFFDVFGFFSFIAFMIIFLTAFFVKRIVMGIVSKLRRKPKSKKLL